MASQRDSADNGRMHELERRLDNMEDRQGALERSRQVMKTIVPSETRRHVRAAWRENLLAVRSLLDNWIDLLDDKPTADADDADDGRETIPID
jgi:hypothetical protein